ncbi:protease inhibitor I42 family protein [Lysobacter niastensis]|uniref:Protease inhibitor I42 family protein n=1 Tax=Lysobacter niastensis TaxID=380629 RepID=A0ABS0BAK3_9GAMM|nr:protease inhibitor I42 family protein [Lysobacter niastensis]MBF6024059.1 protease inhibitor I42 family protein [Lysobacter niastensis]
MELERRWLILPVVLVTIALCDVAYHAQPGAEAHGLVAMPLRTVETAAVVDVGPEAVANPIRLDIGQRLRVHLPASPASGYSWQLEASPPPFLLMETDPGLGAAASLRTRNAMASVDTWTFRAQKQGRASLRYAYRRQWDNTSMPPVRAAVFDIEVE